MRLEKLDVRAVPATVIPAPGTPIGTTTPAALTVTLDEANHAFASVGGGPAVQLQFQVASIAGNQATLAYRLPTAVQPGDVVVGPGETAGLVGSDLLRFTDTIDPITGTQQGWVLVYSDPAETPESGVTDIVLVGPVSPIAPQVTEVRVGDAFGFAVYAADGGTAYTFFSDGSPLTTP